MERIDIGANRAPAMVPMESVDLENLPFRMSLGHENKLELLLISIQNVGLINPPILRECPGGRLEIVLGQRRIEVLKALGIAHLPARVMAATEADDEHCLLAALYDNLATRAFNPMEKALALGHLFRHFPEQEVISRHLPLLGLPPRAGVLDLYLGCLRNLEPALQQALAQGSLSLRAAQHLLALDREAREGLFRVISTLNLNTNQQIQLIDLASDISYETGRSISQCLAAPRIHEILEARPPNPPQQARRLLRELHKARYPRLSRAEETFRRRVQDLGLPRGVSLHAPPFFEAPEYCLQIRFQRGRELKERLGVLSHLPDLERFGDPWEVERG